MLLSMQARTLPRDRITQPHPSTLPPDHPRAALATCLPAWLVLGTLAAGLAGCSLGDETSVPSIADALAAMDEIIEFEDLTGPGSAARVYRITFAQPVDHNDPDGPSFGQYLSLTHFDADAPMILASTGYHNYLGGSTSEPAHLLGANQITVEHRYFGVSRPEPVDWSHLNIEQAAADHHRIVEAFAPLYQGAWLSTGASKGGMTSVFHRRYYPDDVDATIAYVAPISFDVADPRYERFFDEVGPDTCRQQVRELQRELLLRRERLLPLARDYADDADLSFERMGGIERALETGVVELEWGFWQYLGADSCANLPDSTADDTIILNFFHTLQSLDAMSDQSIQAYEPYYYQSFTELGYPSIPTAHLADLLQFDYVDDVGALAPQGAVTTFAPAAMQDIADWLASEGERMIFIYGENDPWSGGAFELGNARDSYLFTAPGGNHGSKIADLRTEDADLALQALEQWTGVVPRPASVLPAPRRAQRVDREGVLQPPPVR